MAHSHYSSKSQPSIDKRNLRNKQSYRLRKAQKSWLDQDISAMITVWRMLRKGTITWIGQIGRQY